MHRMSSGFRFVALAGMAGCLLAVAPSVAGAQGSECATAIIGEPIRLPDGSAHPAGTLTLCASKAYSPVAMLHTTYFDRQPIGWWISRRGESEGHLDNGPVIMFHRGSDGVLSLHGYAIPTGSRTVTYIMKPAHPSANAAIGPDRLAHTSAGQKQTTVTLQARVR